MSAETRLGVSVGTQRGARLVEGAVVARSWHGHGGMGDRGRRDAGDGTVTRPRRVRATGRRAPRRRGAAGTGVARVAGWWPPQVGDRLRHATVHPTGPASAGRVEALVSVLSVFHHAGETRVVGAERLRARGRYLYEIFDRSHAEVGALWPDGQPRPDPGKTGGG